MQWNSLCINSRDTEAARAKWAVTLGSTFITFLTKCPQQIFLLLLRVKVEMDGQIDFGPCIPSD